MRKSLYLLVLAVVLVAGCTSGGTTQMQNSELLRISGVTVTPGTVVAPDEIITIRMKLDNIGQEDVKFVWKNPCYNKRIDICSGSCTKKYVTNNENLNVYSDEYCSSVDFADKSLGKGKIQDPQALITALGPSILYDRCSNIYDFSTTKPIEFSTITHGFELDESKTNLVLKPSRSALLEWTLKAPSETTIANMQQECIFRFQINYQATAKTYTYIYFANPDEKNQRTYTNKDMNLRGENVANFGPVYINFETAQDQPIKGNSNSGTEKNTWTLYTTIRNAGDGIGKVVKGTFKISLPKSDNNFNTKAIIPLTKSDCAISSSNPTCEVKDCTDFGVTDSNNRDNLQYAKDDSRLKLYSKQSSRFSCTLPAPKVDVLEPYRFISSADYVYTIDKELKILTVPKRT